MADDDQIDSNQKPKKELDVDDEAVKDRWSRYIGAMGVEAVAKQAAASIFLSGAGALGVEIAKNIVLSGCKSFTLHDPKPVSFKDLSGQFFINQDTDFGDGKSQPLTRAQACLPRLQQLNSYVRCKQAENAEIPIADLESLASPPWNLHTYDVIIMTEADHHIMDAVNQFCRKHGIKFICADCVGVFSRVFNDFGDSFEVLDKNGEELQDVMIQKISNEKAGVVELIQNAKHKLEDGDEVVFQGVEGMKLKAGMKHDDEQVKSDSINDTIHKVKVLTPYSFTIGDTEKFEAYERNGVAKQLKTKVQFKFKSYAESVRAKVDDMPLDGNLAIADWEKMHHNQAAHICFQALDKFKADHKRWPKVWDLADAKKFAETAVALAKESKVSDDDLKEDGPLLRLLYLFPLQSQGVFNPLCAFLGGLVAQECVKAITQKFSPTHQLFYYDAVEVLPEFRVKEEVSDLEKAAETDKEATAESLFKNYVEKVAKTVEKGDRSDGLRVVLGQEMIEKLAEIRLFMVGAGAIGCELLKNYAMLGVGCAKKDEKAGKKGGSIVLTDPDVIEVSNLNRQFLFREKHLRKPKSSTAAAAAIQMNKDLKGNIIARLDKVHEGTNHIFTDQFFEGLTIVTNALDNLAARRYVDSRCVTAKTPLLESGTLGPKGHVQVILPHLTESYGSQKDPEDNTEIPHCTLKMFPEETLHCVEWARDLFGQLFSQAPKSALKILEDGESVDLSTTQDVIAFKEGLRLLKERPKTFADCVEHARLLFEKYFSHDIQ